MIATEVMRMTRIARTRSESGIYHVMLRGIDQLQLFFDDGDRRAFLETLVRVKGQRAYSLLAYSLMGNHVHLLVGEQADGVSVSNLIQRITTSYARRYNTKYGRTGYLFQGRFKSETVESESYLLQLVRYIHNNPVRVGLPIGSWTSYDEYMGASLPMLTDTDLILGMFSPDPRKARDQFDEFLHTTSDDTGSPSILGNYADRKLTDTEAIALIKRFGKVANCTDLASVEKDRRTQALSQLKGQGLSIRRIARLTGINRSIILKARKG
jgi:REP element-mobilizing transposase RayT